MELIAIVTVLAGLQAFVFAFQTGQQRVKHNVAAPAMSGHPDVERAIRVHANTVEQLVILLPALWIFAYYVHAQIGAALGLVFIVGRFIYRAGYMQDPSKRSTGFGISALAMMVLAIGGLVGAVMALL